MPSILPETKDILACTARMAEAQETKMDGTILGLSAKAKDDKDYKTIYNALKARKDPKNLPRDHPAQAAAVVWLTCSLEPDMPSLVLYMGHVWVPETAKAKVLQKVHLSHVGENKTLALARGLYFWPGMVKDIKKFVWSCQECGTILDAQAT